MERYIVSARKYRPQTFDTVVGQQHITNTLEHAIKQNHLAQALLFCGPRGVGKTTCARILAKMINAQDGLTDEDFSLNIFELDAASNNSVDDIRRLIDQVRFAPQVGRFKVYIIDEVHMLSAAAFNAFLKTLEEPPAHAIFILATTEKHKIIPTILSRCQIFDFKRITVDDIADHLEKVAKSEGIEAEREGLHIIAQKADGALRDALSIFDRLASYEGDKITYQNVVTNLDILDYEYFFKATNFVLEQNLSGLMLLFGEVLEKGFEGHQFINGWASHLRDLLVSKDPQTVQLLEVGPTIKQRYLAQSAQTDVPFIIFALRILGDCDSRYKNTTNQRLLVEVACMQVLQLLEKKKPEQLAPQNKHAPKSVMPVQKVTVQHAPPAPQKPAEPTLAVLPVPQKPQVEETEPQTMREKPPQMPAAPTKQPEAPKPAPISGTGPSWLQKAQAKTSGISLSDLAPEKKVEETTEETKVEVPTGPEEVFGEHEFNTHWNGFLETITSRKGIHSLLSANKPQIKNLTELHFTLAAKTQESYLQEVMMDMLGYLRNNLNNFALKAHINIAEGQNEKKIYHAEDKYKAMAEINPHLETLRKLLDLQID